MSKFEITKSESKLTVAHHTGDGKWIRYYWLTIDEAKELCEILNKEFEYGKDSVVSNE